MTATFPQPGALFANRYEVGALLAMGGFSRVYRTRDMEVPRDVALKVMSPTRLESTGLGSVEKRFYREARVISRLVSPYTVRLFDYGRSVDGLLFLAMELVEGRDLAHVLEHEGPLSEERVRTILAQMCASLREAHALDIVHRDVKPANVMLQTHANGGETVKVIDFGVAKSIANDAVHQSQLTVGGIILGTPRYMAPEQALGTGTLGPPSDLFSVGVVAYEMLVGRVPRADGLGAIRDAARNELAVPKLLGVTDELREIVNRLLCYDPSDRFQSADDVVRALGVDVDVAASKATGNEPRAGMGGAPVAFPILGSSLGSEDSSTVIWADVPISADTRMWTEAEKPDEAADGDERTTAFQRVRPSSVDDDLRTTRFEASRSREVESTRPPPEVTRVGIAVLFVLLALLCLLVVLVVALIAD